MAGPFLCTPLGLGPHFGFLPNLLALTLLLSESTGHWHPWCPSPRTEGTFGNTFLTLASPCSTSMAPYCSKIKHRFSVLWALGRLAQTYPAASSPGRSFMLQPEHTCPSPRRPHCCHASGLQLELLRCVSSLCLVKFPRCRLTSEMRSEGRNRGVWREGEGEVVGCCQHLWL